MAKIRGCINPKGELVGYSLYCPGCKHRHVVYVSGPVRWDFNGNMDSPTFSRPFWLINLVNIMFLSCQFAIPI